MAFILLMRVEAFAFSSCVRGARPARCLSILQAIDQDGQAQAAVGKVEPTHFNGTTHSSSEFITHFIAGAQPGLTVESAVQSLLPRQDLAAGPQQHRDMLLKNEDDTLLARAHPSLRHSTLEFPSTGEPLSAVELLAIGSTWYLSKDSPRDPALGGKPTRPTLADAGKILEEGDYLRVHNPPRRFPAVNLYDWGRLLDEDGSKAQLDRLPGVVVAEDEEAGYIIIDKPAGLPVHGTVDNTLENVSAAVGRALLKKREADLMESIRNTAKYSSSTLGNERDYRKRKRKGKQKEEAEAKEAEGLRKVARSVSDFVSSVAGYEGAELPHSSDTRSTDEEAREEAWERGARVGQGGETLDRGARSREEKEIVAPGRPKRA